MGKVSAENSYDKVKYSEGILRKYDEETTAHRLASEGIRYSRRMWACEAVGMVLEQYPAHFKPFGVQIRDRYSHHRFVWEHMADAALIAAKCANVVEGCPPLACVAPGITAYYGHVAALLRTEFNRFEGFTRRRSYLSVEVEDQMAQFSSLDVVLPVLRDCYSTLDRLSGSGSGSSSDGLPAAQARWKSLPSVKAATSRIAGQLDRAVQDFARRLQADCAVFDYQDEGQWSVRCEGNAQAVLSVGHCLDPSSSSVLIPATGLDSLVAEYRALASLHANKVVELAGLFDAAPPFELQRHVHCCVLFNRLADGLCAEAERCRLAAQRAEDPARRLFLQAEELFREAVDLHRAAVDSFINAPVEEAVYEDPVKALDIAGQAEALQRSAETVLSSGFAHDQLEAGPSLDVPVADDYSADVARSRVLMEVHCAGMDRGMKLLLERGFAKPALTLSSFALVQGIERLLRPPVALSAVLPPALPESCLSSLREMETEGPPALDADCAWLGRAAVNVQEWLAYLGQVKERRDVVPFLRHLRRINVELGNVLQDVEKKRGLDGGGQDDEEVDDQDYSSGGMRIKLLADDLDDSGDDSDWDSEAELTLGSGPSEEEDDEESDDADEDESQSESDEEETGEGELGELGGDWDEGRRNEREARYRRRRQERPDPCDNVVKSKAVVAALLGAMRALRTGDPEAAVRWEELVWYAGRIQVEQSWHLQMYECLTAQLAASSTEKCEPRGTLPLELDNAALLGRLVAMERQRAKSVAKLVAVDVGEAFVLFACGDESFENARGLVWGSVTRLVGADSTGASGGAGGAGAGGTEAHELHFEIARCYYYAAVALLEGRRTASWWCWASAAQLRRLTVSYAALPEIRKRQRDAKEQRELLACAAADRYTRAAELFDAGDADAAERWNAAATATTNLLEEWRESDSFSGKLFRLADHCTQDAIDYATYLAEAARATQQRQRLSGSDSEGWMQAEERCKLWEQVVALQKGLMDTGIQRALQIEHGLDDYRKKGPGTLELRDTEAKTADARERVKELLARIGHT